ncbi:MAG: molybdate ABC transporter substrate-binding protein [Chlorobiales bacterium]|nr:molybdate ABC transporter substrate-binding protein [Chlorobiales bacterium]
MLKKLFLLFALALFAASPLFAGEFTIYAASDMQYAMKEIAAAYKTSHPDDDAKIVFGASGKGYTQIVNGAPFDLYFSADMEYVNKLEKEGLTITPVKLYAIGRIGLWARKDAGIDVSKGINALFDSKVKKIAVANWEVAPYGVAAKNAMLHYGVFEKVSDKIVRGENVSQTLQYVQSGAAEIGFVPHSLALNENVQKDGVFQLLPANTHNEIRQGYAVLKNAKGNESAMAFYKFIESPDARKVFDKYGFALPGKGK